MALAERDVDPRSPPALPCARPVPPPMPRDEDDAAAAEADPAAPVWGAPERPEWACCAAAAVPEAEGGGGSLGVEE